MVEYEDAAAVAILSYLDGIEGFAHVITGIEDPSLQRILEEMARIIKSRIPASKPTSSQWRPMRTALRDGTVVEVLWDERNHLAAWDVENGWFRCAAGLMKGTGIENVEAWRPAHPEWNEAPDAG